MSLSLDELQQQHLTALQHDYQQLLEAAGFDGVLIYSGASRPHYADDQYPAFNAYGHFLHWVPLVEAQHCWLLIQPGRRPFLKVHAPDDYWHLPTRLPEAPWCEAFEIVLSNDIAPPPCTSERLAVIGDIDPASIEPLTAVINPPGLLTALDERRMHKSAYEIACLGEANRLALKGHHAARQCFTEGGAELDIHLAYLSASRQRESRLPYDSIVGVNQHASVLHYQHYQPRVPAERYSLLVDAGHRYRGYCADITRTWAGPQAPELFTGLIASLHTLRQALIDDCAPGVDFVELHQRMHHGLGERLQQHGLVHCSADAAVAQGITQAFCPHGLGHPLGLQVHDVAGKVDSCGHPLPPPQAYPALRLTRQLAPGMVVTIEPGCYVIPMLLEPLRQTAAGSDVNWSLVEHLAPCGGIRVEDNIAITENGHHNLTATAALALFD